MNNLLCNIYVDFYSVHLWNIPVLLIKNKLKDQLATLKSNIFSSAILELSNYQTQHSSVLNDKKILQR